MGWGNDPAQLSRVTEVAEQRHWVTHSVLRDLYQFKRWTKDLGGTWSPTWTPFCELLYNLLTLLCSSLFTTGTVLICLHFRNFACLGSSWRQKCPVTPSWQGRQCWVSQELFQPGSCKYTCRQASTTHPKNPAEKEPALSSHTVWTLG